VNALVIYKGLSIRMTNRPFGQGGRAPEWPVREPRQEYGGIWPWGGRREEGGELDRHGWSRNQAQVVRAGWSRLQRRRVLVHGALGSRGRCPQHASSGGGRWGKGAAEVDVGRDTHEGDVVEWGTGARRRGRLLHHFKMPRVRRGSVCRQVAASCLVGDDWRGEALVEARGPRETRG
jgi:hypothetical protein